MSNGVVKFFNTEKGFGFLVPEDGSGDVFVHANDLRTSGIEKLLEKQKVTFDIVPGREGKPRASNVTLIPD